MRKISELLLSHIVAYNKATARQKSLGKRARDGSRHCGRVFSRDGFGQLRQTPAPDSQSGTRRPRCRRRRLRISSNWRTVLPVTHVGDEGVVIAGFQRGEKRPGYRRHASAEADRLRRALERGYRGLERIDCRV